MKKQIIQEEAISSGLVKQTNTSNYKKGLLAFLLAMTIVAGVITNNCSNRQETSIESANPPAPGFEDYDLPSQGQPNDGYDRGAVIHDSDLTDVLIAERRALFEESDEVIAIFDTPYGPGSFRAILPMEILPDEIWTKANSTFISEQRIDGELVEKTNSVNVLWKNRGEEVINDINTDNYTRTIVEQVNLYGVVTSYLKNSEFNEMSFKGLFTLRGDLDLSKPYLNLSTFETLNEQGQWITDGNLYISENEIGSNEEKRFVIIGQIPITELIQNHNETFGVGGR